MKRIREWLSETIRTIKHLHHNWIVNITTKCVLVCAVIFSLILIFTWKTLPPLIPLWYSRAWGSDQLASPFWLLSLPILCLFVHGINLLISCTLLKEYRVFTQVMMSTSLVTSIILGITLMKVVFLVT